MEYDTRTTEYKNSESLQFSGILEPDVYMLYCILASSKFLHAQDRRLYGLNLLLLAHERSSIVSIVFSLAIRGRNILDNNQGKAGDVSNKVVGELIVDLSTVGLTFREACNKIVHSEHINFDIEDYKAYHDYGSVGDLLYIYGSKGKQSWKATLKLYEFLSVYMEVTHSQIDSIIEFED